MSNPKEPFKLVEGMDQRHSRILAIDRINYLSGIDLRTKSVYYRHALDLEMWQRWYRHLPRDHKIDEEWIQRAVEVIKGIEQDTEENHKKASELATKEFKLYKSTQVNQKYEEQKKPKITKIFQLDKQDRVSILDKIKKLFKKEKTT